MLSKQKMTPKTLNVNQTCDCKHESDVCNSCHEKHPKSIVKMDTDSDSDVKQTTIPQTKYPIATKKDIRPHVDDSDIDSDTSVTSVKLDIKKTISDSDDSDCPIIVKNTDIVSFNITPPPQYSSITKPIKKQPQRKLQEIAIVTPVKKTVPRKVALPEVVDNSTEEEEISCDHRVRSFKVCFPDTNDFNGRFTGLTPYQAANKALSKYFRETENYASEIEFSICESTRKSKKSKYTYIGCRQKLDVPVTYKIADGREIVKNFKNSLRKIKKTNIYKIDADKIAADKIAADKIAADKIAADKILADKIVADKIATDKIVADKIVADKIVADKIAADKAAKIIADKIVADKIVADKIAADKIVADKIAADKIVADKIAADKIKTKLSTLKSSVSVVADKKKLFLDNDSDSDSDIEIDLDIKTKLETVNHTYEDIKIELEKLNKQIKERTEEIICSEKSIMIKKKDLLNLEKQRNKLFTLFPRAINAKIKAALIKKVTPKKTLNKTVETNVNKKELPKKTVKTTSVSKSCPVPPKLIKYLGLEKNAVLPKPQIVRLLNQKFKDENMKIGQVSTLNKEAAMALGKEEGREITLWGFITFIRELYDEAFPPNNIITV